MISKRLIKTLTASCAATVWLAGCAATDAVDSQSATGEVTIVKSQNDNRSYRYLVLDNELTAILVHKPEEGKAGVALAVARGSNDDWPEYEGIAHFLEHMLFLGTEKYPDPDEYSDFISKHGGNHNAYTANELTNYFFDIDEQHYAEGLDRFAQFFVAPLLDDTYVEREKNAVHSEYQMQMRNDGWRGFSVLKTIMNPAHPMSKFSIGSAETLADVDRAIVKDFYEKNYSSDQMTLVTVSQRSLDDQEALVRELFGDVPNRNLGESPIPPSLYLNESLPFVYGYQTIMSNRSLSIEWSVPDIKPHYRTQPLSYIANLVGHEGEGSLHQLLQGRGWINSLSAGGSRSDRGNSLFSVSIGVTDTGWEHLDEIHGLVFKYLDDLRAQPIEAWRYDEQAAIADLNFRYMEHGSTIGTVNRLINAAEIYEPQDLLRGPYLMTDFDEAVIRDYLNRLTRDRAITSIAAPDMQTEKTEKWFNVPYTLEPKINPTHVADHTFKLPEPNVFVPADTTVISTLHDKPPASVPSADGIELLHATDTAFSVPRAYVVANLQFKEPLSTPQDVVNNTLLTRLLNIRLNARSYPALIAGLNSRFSANAQGLSISVNGYDDKQALLIEEMLTLLREFEIDANQLENQKIELAKQYNNFKDERPFQQAYSSVSHVLLSTSWAPSALEPNVADVTRESLADWMSERLTDVSATVLIVGNVSTDDAQALGRTIEANVDLQAADRRTPITTVPDTHHIRNLNIEHDDAVYLVSFLGEDASIQERALVRLLSQVVSQAYFNELRTEQQLGYATIAQSSQLFTHPAMVFLVQSPVADTRHLQMATNQFIATRRIELDEMTDAEFDGFKQGLLTSLLERDKNLSERASRYGSDLAENNLAFNTREQLAAVIKSATLNQLLDAYDRILDLDSPRRIEVFSPGKKGTELTHGIAITDPLLYK